MDYLDFTKYMNKTFLPYVRSTFPKLKFELNYDTASGLINHDIPFGFTCFLHTDYKVDTHHYISSLITFDCWAEEKTPKIIVEKTNLNVGCTDYKVTNLSLNWADKFHSKCQEGIIETNEFLNMFENPYKKHILKMLKQVHKDSWGEFYEAIDKAKESKDVK